MRSRNVRDVLKLSSLVQPCGRGKIQGNDDNKLCFCSLHTSWEANPMDMNAFNVSATLNIFRLIAKPSLCLPHATIATFNQLPIPLSNAFNKYGKADIRAVVLDKDNCFAVPHANEVYKPYEVNDVMFLCCCFSYLYLVVLRRNQIS